MQYLVKGTSGPGFATPEETVAILENIILPSFDTIVRLEREQTILAGGLPVADRAFVFILEAESNDEADALVRSIPMWGSLNWEVTPLQSFEARAAYERNAVEKFKQLA